MSLTPGYQFHTPPYDHQRDVFHASKDDEFFGLLMQQGTGKSKVIVDTAAYLHLRDKIDAVVIIAPKGLYENWINEDPEDFGQFPTHLHPSIRPYYLLWENKTKNKTYRRKLELAADPPKGYDLTVMAVNIEAISAGRAHEYLMWFIRQRRCLLVVDESTKIKNRTSKRTKRTLELARLSGALYRRILTGTPVTRSPLDAYPQFEFLQKNYFGQRTWSAFQNRYAITELTQIGGRRPFKKVVGYRRVEELAKLIQEHSYRVLRADCLDLPPKIYSKFQLELAPEQRKIYDRMKEHALAEYGDTTVAAPLVITQMMKAHQITCGYIIDDNKVVHRFFDEPAKNPRIAALLELLETIDGKVIIWANFVPCIEDIYNALAEVYGRDAVRTYYGGTSDEDRKEALRSFKREDGGARFFISNQSTGGRGLTLTVAATEVYYSNNYDLEERLQSEDRAHRIGQTKSLSIIDLVASNTVDGKIIRSLRSKNMMAATVTGDQLEDWI